MRMPKQRLTTRENNYMSLSCCGAIEIDNGVVTEVSFRGMPRTHGDMWTNYYKQVKVGDEISQETIENLLSYDGRFNVKSSIEDIS